VQIFYGEIGVKKLKTLKNYGNIAKTTKIALEFEFFDKI